MDRWYEIYEQFCDYANKKDLPQPWPLLVMHRSEEDLVWLWDLHVTWATENGCAFIIDQLSEEDYVEAELYRGFGLSARDLNYWSGESRIRPTDDEIDNYLQILKSNWERIVGKEISKNTKPLKFMGNKARRLLVFADESSIPPWGGWDYLSKDETSRRKFTVFRSAINKAISPHEVDHIDFTFEL